jgi:hypothetical protein
LKKGALRAGKVERRASALRLSSRRKMRIERRKARRFSIFNFQFSIPTEAAGVTVAERPV